MKPTSYSEVYYPTPFRILLTRATHSQFTIRDETSEDGYGIGHVGERLPVERLYSLQSQRDKIRLLYKQGEERR